MQIETNLFALCLSTSCRLCHHLRFSGKREIEIVSNVVHYDGFICCEVGKDRKIFCITANNPIGVTDIAQTLENCEIVSLCIINDDRLLSPSKVPGGTLETPWTQQLIGK